MEEIKLEILGLSSSQSQTGSFALVLGEADGNRRLPIIIGMFEAQAIAIEIEKIKPNRPMTHDLFRSFADAFSYNVEKIIISDLKEGVFFAKIICVNGNKKEEVDARPSDAIAIALRFNAPIYTYTKILSEAGIVLTEENEDIIEEVVPPSETRKKGKSKDLKDISTEKLNQMLQDAIEKEDYESAAKIRDELDRRN
ncbi:MAG: DUF151 domain-containing protein [Cyclobacteriaceae bacterium]|nr:DUF151 domain-containing protein [Cyclobacteriaceae bacterium]